jgi:hypothetical protein
MAKQIFAVENAKTTTRTNGILKVLYLIRNITSISGITDNYYREQARHSPVPSTTTSPKTESLSFRSSQVQP